MQQLRKAKLKNVDIKTFYQRVKPTDASIKKIASKTVSMFAGRLLMSAEYCALWWTISLGSISIDGCGSWLIANVATLIWRILISTQGWSCDFQLTDAHRSTTLTLRLQLPKNVKVLRIAVLWINSKISILHYHYTQNYLDRVKYKKGLQEKSF